MCVDIVEDITRLLHPRRWMASREEIIVANSYVYNYYHDGKEANYFLSTDRINTMAILPLSKVPIISNHSFPLFRFLVFRRMSNPLVL